jgi:nicotinamide-nucleotide amidase
MKADIITIGDEILIGQVVDTNSAFIASEFDRSGIYVRRIHSIPDIENDIISTLDESLQNSDIIILTGGLGPTNDDITKKTLTKYFGGKLVLHKESWENLKKFFRYRGIEISERNKKQAEVPDNCQVLTNHSGTAPGMMFHKNDKLVVSLPGVPFEMKELIVEQVIPYIQEEFKLPVRFHKTILTIGIGESYLADQIRDWEEKLSSEFRLAYLPSPGMVRLRLSISGSNRDELNKMFNTEVETLTTLIGNDCIYGLDEDTLEKVVGKMLLENKCTLSVAESCTGGEISHLITSVPGSSSYFKGSVTAYANEIKASILNVPDSLIREYGAVSKEVVEAMARGVQKLMKTDFSIATSGIAGPDGGTPEKPVGTTWIAIATPERIVSQNFLMGEHRGRNISKASLTALNMLRIEIRQIIENIK